MDVWARENTFMCEPDSSLAAAAVARNFSCKRLNDRTFARSSGILFFSLFYLFHNFHVAVAFNMFLEAKIIYSLK